MAAPFGLTSDPFAARLEAALSMTTRVKLRHVLRGLARETEALAVALALKDELLEYDGDFYALPGRLPIVRSSVVEVETLKSKDHEDRPMVMVRIRTMVGRPSFLLLLADPRPLDLAVLSQSLERVVATVEVLVAGAYDALGYDA